MVTRPLFGGPARGCTLAVSLTAFAVYSGGHLHAFAHSTTVSLRACELLGLRTGFLVFCVYPFLVFGLPSLRFDIVPLLHRVSVSLFGWAILGF